jgi:hypothetical protein
MRRPTVDVFLSSPEQERWKRLACADQILRVPVSPLSAALTAAAQPLGYSCSVGKNLKISRKRLHHQQSLWRRRRLQPKDPVPLHLLSGSKRNVGSVRVVAQRVYMAN